VKKISDEDMQKKNENELQLLLKLGLDETLSREAVKKFPGDPQSAINFVIKGKS